MTSTALPITLCKLSLPARYWRLGNKLVHVEESEEKLRASAKSVVTSELLGQCTLA